MRLRPLYSAPRHVTRDQLDPLPIEEGGGFVLSYLRAGNPKGIPVLLLHGGPGGSIHNSLFRFFHPDLFDVIAFDQRGCGQSLPLAETRNNDSWRLLDDIERLRQHLGIDQWILFGGSWGSTLALLAAQQRPEHCLGLVLRGIFLGRTEEIDWFLVGMRTFFPEAWRDFIAAVDLDPQRDAVVASDPTALLARYRARLMNDDPAIRLAAAQAWARYEASCSTLLPAPVERTSPEADQQALSLATLEAHYFAHGLFLGDYRLLDHCQRIAHLPVEIVQGRYDVVCPPISAQALAEALPQANLTMIANAGHSSMESGTAAALMTAVETLASRIQQQRRADGSVRQAPLPSPELAC